MLLCERRTCVQGGGPADKEVRNADRVDLVPWRPKITRSNDLQTKVALGVYAAFLLFEIVGKVTPDGVINGAILGVLLNGWKQYTLFPVGASDMQKRLEGGWRNVLRCVSLPRCSCPPFPPGALVVPPACALPANVAPANVAPSAGGRCSRS